MARLKMMARKTVKRVCFNLSSRSSSSNSSESTANAQIPQPRPSTSRASTSNPKVQKTKQKTQQKSSANFYKGIQFSTSLQLKTYKKLVNRPLVSTRSIDWKLFAQVGIETQFKNILSAAGLLFLAEIKEDTYKNLTLEFLSSLQVQKKSSEDIPSGTWVFKLKNIAFTVTPFEFGRIFKLSFLGNNMLKRTFPADDAWSALVGRQEPYNTRTTIESDIKHPLDRIFHRFLTYTLTCGGESYTKVIRDDLFLMWSFKNDKPMNPTWWFMHRIQKLVTGKSGRINIGGYITYLAKELGIQFDQNDEIHKIPFFEQNDFIGEKLLQGAQVIDQTKVDKHNNPRRQVPKEGESSSQAAASTRKRPRTRSEPVVDPEPSLASVFAAINAQASRLTNIELQLAEILKNLKPPGSSSNSPSL